MLIYTCILIFVVSVAAALLLSLLSFSFFFSFFLLSLPHLFFQALILHHSADFFTVSVPRPRFFSNFLFLPDDDLLLVPLDFLLLLIIQALPLLLLLPLGAFFV